MAAASSSSRSSAVGGAAVEEEHQLITELCADLTKAVLKSPYLDEFQTNDQLLCAFLAQYCEQTAAAKAAEAQIAMDAQRFMAFVNNVYRPAVDALPAEKLARLFPSPSAAPEEYAATATSTALGPMVPMKALQSQLKAAGVAEAVVPDIFELCRFLDAAHQQTSPAFGSVNLTHVLAVVLSLVPVRVGVWELLRLLFHGLGDASADASFGAGNPPDSARRPISRGGRGTIVRPSVVAARVVSCWQAIDHVHRDGLQRLAKTLADTPGVTFALLAELHPWAATVATPQYLHAEQPAREGEDETTSPGGDAADDGADVAGDDSEGEAEEEDRREAAGAGDPAARGFWEHLVEARGGGGAVVDPSFSSPPHYGGGGGGGTVVQYDA